MSWCFLSSVGTMPYITVKRVCDIRRKLEAYSKPFAMNLGDRDGRKAAIMSKATGAR